MKYNPNKHHRRTIRLQGYDYSTPNAYFVTICTQNRACLFGDITEDGMQLNNAGSMIQTCWEELPLRFPMLKLDAYIVMPNHFHAIATLTTTSYTSEASESIVRSASRRGTAGAFTLGDIVGAFKSITTTAYIRQVRQSQWPPFDRRLWQQNYWEHIIRSSTELDHIRKYIQTNPAKWYNDQLHPSAPPNRFNNG